MVIHSNRLFITLASIASHFFVFSDTSQILIIPQVQKASYSSEPLISETENDAFAKSLDLSQLRDSEEVHYSDSFKQLASEEYPIEGFFDSNALNKILQMIRQISSSCSQKVRVKKGNCFLLFGPQEVDIGMIAQVLALRACYEILYIDARKDLRTCGESKRFASIEKLLLCAQKISTERQIAIVIEGLVDSTSVSTTNEEGYRSLGPFIQAVDKQLHGFKVPILCTTHYPERIDPLIRCRLNIIEIPRPKSDFSFLGLLRRWKSNFLAWFVNAHDS